MEGPQSLWESALLRYSPKEILFVSFAGIFVLTLVFAYVVIDPKLPSGTRPYQNLSIQYAQPRHENTAFCSTDDDELVKWCSLRDIDREIHLSQSNSDHQTSLRRRTNHLLNPPEASSPVSIESTADIIHEAIKYRSADCSMHLKQIADRLDTGDVEGMKAPLQAMQDTLAYFKAPSTRDINQVSVFCKALVKHDGLDLLQKLVQTCADADIQSIAQAIIEDAVPSIWS
ncbi:hypothetical protein H257_06538 [Aphanomyces astaci]|uniref:Uncharacterized protein n=1 Tax=Aphanomyces astaci TaxID=112090 RepID=W4GMQ6_APHAT|nr:hypothetical protein H257_06538 [Aphanomyces astaci]ETV80173.1 hypothetical protein H257_06538 [Aphanomyces astaci]|eukprot:XP_009830097.1 hypothetical protein H257_06538 [Aphanomyces astaci]